MSTVLRLLGYRFYWYSNENGEPIHIHVRKENRKAKFWLSPISLARNEKRIEKPSFGSLPFLWHGMMDLPHMN